MAAEAGGIGARLRAGREKLGLTVLQVAERIHTDPRIVEAIEAENYETLGAPVYARGHIRHYSELVGESAAELTAMYSRLSKVGQPDITRIVKAPLPNESNKLVAPALLVIAVFAVAGAIWWVSALSKKNALADTHVLDDQTPAAQTAPATESPTATTTEASRAPAQTPPGDRNAPSGAMVMQPRPNVGGAATSQSRSGSTAAPSQSRAEGGSPAAAMSAHPRSASSTAAAATPRVTPTSPSSTTPSRLASAAPTPTQPGSAAANPAPAGSEAGPSATAPSRPKSQAQVTLRFSADSWTEVYDATGARLFYDVGGANSVQTVVGTPPLRIVLGNASGVVVEFNGHNKPIANLSQPDGSVQFSINRSGQIVRAKPVADGG